MHDADADEGLVFDDGDGAAAAVAALMSGRVRAPKGTCVAALLCGAGVAGLD